MNGQTWYRGFVNRHATSLKPRHSHALAPNQTAKDLFVLVKAWISEVGDSLRQRTFRAGTTWNADETLMTLRNLGHGIVCVEWMGKGKSNYVRPRGTHTGSLIIFSNGEGHSPLVVIILPADFGTSTEKELDIALPDIRLLLSENTKVYYAGAECGRVPNELWRTVMEILQEILRLRTLAESRSST